MRTCAPLRGRRRRRRPSQRPRSTREHLNTRTRVVVPLTDRRDTLQEARSNQEQTAEASAVRTTLLPSGRSEVANCVCSLPGTGPGLNSQETDQAFVDGARAWSCPPPHQDAPHAAPTTISRQTTGFPRRPQPGSKRRRDGPQAPGRSNNGSNSRGARRTPAFDLPLRSRSSIYQREMARWRARTESKTDGIVNRNALYSCSNVSQKSMNEAEAVAGAVNDVGLAAAAKPASPAANSEDASHFLLQTSAHRRRKGEEMTEHFSS